MYYCFLRRGADTWCEEYPDLIDRYECLRCKRYRAGGDCVMCTAEPKLYGCVRCMTLYVWYSPEWTDLRFFRALTTEALADKPAFQIGL
jgi:hypothetical protein